MYQYNNPYTFLNRTNGINETLPVTCLCARYSECGCDEDDDLSYLDTIIGNGSIASLDRTLVNIAPVNETKTIVLNGTLPNGTETGALSGGSSESNTGQASLIEAGGFWVIGVIVAATVWVL